MSRAKQAKWPSRRARPVTVGERGEQRAAGGASESERSKCEASEASSHTGAQAHKYCAPAVCLTRVHDVSCLVTCWYESFES